MPTILKDDMDVNTRVEPETADAEERRWYVGIVGNNSERSVSDRLTALGLETYVASQEELRQWRDGRRRKVRRVVLPGLVFIKATDAERRLTLSGNLIRRYLSDRAAARPSGLNAPPAVIPDEQLERLRFMLGQSDIPVSFSDRPLPAGTRVRVIRGPLRGLEGEVAPGVGRDPGVTVRVRLDNLGCALLDVARTDIEPD